jgi:hypothetical protein
MANNITITISIQQDGHGKWQVKADAGVADSITENGKKKARGWRQGKIFWTADASVGGRWVVGMKDKSETPFKHGRWLFSGVGTARDTGHVDPGADEDFEYWVMAARGSVEGLNEMVFADPILAIRNPPGGHPMTDLAELAKEAALLKEQAAKVAEHAADLSTEMESLARHARELATQEREEMGGEEAGAGDDGGDSGDAPES